MTEFKEKFVGFINVLGWKDFTGRATDETDTEITPADLAEAKEILIDQRLKADLQKFGHTICPDSKRIQQDLDMVLTGIPGGVVISCEISAAGIITLIRHCHNVVKNLMLNQGLLCRGMITRDTISHFNGDRQKAGPPGIKRRADTSQIPFVEIDPVVRDYIRQSTDTCVNINFERVVETDNDTTVFFPYKSEENDFLIGDFCGHKFDPDRERASNNAVRSAIIASLDLLEKDGHCSHGGPAGKILFYRRILTSQLTACDETDAFLCRFQESFHGSTRQCDNPV